MAKAQTRMIPNTYALMAIAPGLLETYLTGGGAFRQESGFSPIEQQVVLLADSRANHCTYCVTVHTGVADMAEVPAEVTDAFRPGDRLPDARLGALAHFATTMVDTRGCSRGPMSRPSCRRASGSETSCRPSWPSG
jgi:AhpD family alkylhydroperoxidase